MTVSQAAREPPSGARPPEPAAPATRLLAICSGGGHWMQMMRLRPAFAGLDTAYCTVVSDYRNDVPGSRFYVIPDANRFTAYRIPLLLRRIGAVIAAERPDIVLTTGAMPGLLALVIAKSFHGARTVWLDSVANVDVMSTSARLARRFADAHLTQWPYLASGGTQYWGRVL